MYVYLQKGKCLFILVDTENKKKRIETPPRIKTPLVHPASSSQKERKKMPTSEKYLTLPPAKSIMKSPPKKRER